MVVDEFGTHKPHGAWYRQSACYPHSDRVPSNLEQHWRTCAADTAWNPREFPWECIGPFDIAGRVTSLAVHPTDHNLLFAGAANGGVWRSKDGGGSWESQWAQWASPAIGALAFDPADPNTIYAATGEANGSADCYPGTGLYVTHDLGGAWTQLADAGDANLPRRIGALAPDPFTPGTIWIGGVMDEEVQPAGLYYSADAGKTWTREDIFSRRSYWCHSIVFHPNGAAFVAIESGGAQTGIWRRSGGKWTQLRRGLPRGDKTGRISLAIAASRPDTMYAMAASRSGRTVLGVFRTTDRGEHWEEIAGEQFANDHSASYNCTLAVRADDPETVVCGANDIHITRDGGGSWVRASRWDANPDSPEYVHADQHAIALPGGDLIYTACDGGIARSTDFGRTWKMRTQNLCNTMFLNMDVCPRNAAIVGGGAQDNGCLLADGSGNGYLPILGGDGLSVVFDPHREGHAFAARSDIHIAHHNGSRDWAAGTWHGISPRGMSDSEHRQNAVGVIALDPVHPRTLWTGSHRMWRTLDDGHHWEHVSPVLDGSGISAIEAAGKIVFAGTARGGVFRSEDGGETWSGDLSGPEIPARYIGRITRHPKQPHHIVIAAGGSGVVSTLIPEARRNVAYLPAGPDDAMHHVFYSEDNGDTWRAIDSTDMPDVPCHAAVFETRDPHRLFVSNDCGVWMTANLKDWRNITGALPNVMVSDLVYHAGTHALYAATYGRGLWRLVLPEGDANAGGWS